MRRRTEKWMNWTVAIVLLTQVAMVVAWFALRPRNRDLFADGTLELASKCTPGTQLQHAHAHIRGTSLRVHGRIVAETALAKQQDGSVMVLIRAPDGRELCRVGHEYHLSPELARGGGGFSVELPIVPPKGSVVHVSWVTKR